MHLKCKIEKQNAYKKLYGYKKKHKKEKKKRIRSDGSSSDSEKSSYSHKKKKRKKAKSKKRRESRSPSHSRSRTPSKIKLDPESLKVSYKTEHIKSEDVKVKEKIKIEPKEEAKTTVHIKSEKEPSDFKISLDAIDTSLIPMPDSPRKENKPNSNDLRLKLDSKRETENDKTKGKIQIKNLKFSTVFEETVKKAEEEARKKAEKYEEGEYTDSSSSSVREVIPNSQSPSGVKLADSEKKRLLEVARRNAINMLKNGAVPAGAAALPPHTRNQVMAAIQSGGKSVDELTDFCKHLSKKEALGELSSVSSHDEDMSENEDTLAFHHPFLVKEKAPIVMNIRGGAPLPIKTNALPIANKEELRLQFPVSSGSQHREKASEWVPVSPKKDMVSFKFLGFHRHYHTRTASKRNTLLNATLSISLPTSTIDSSATIFSVALVCRIFFNSLPPDGQGYPSFYSFGWAKDTSLGQFTGSTGAQILTPRELASGTQAWAKKDQLVRAAPVEGGMGMHLLQKMGWTPGRGLGKEGTGTLQPLMLEVKLDTRGLQAKEEVSRNNKAHRVTRGRGAAPLVAGGKHPVSLLGEYCSKQKLGPPEYNLCFECGPDHKKNFLFRVKVAGIEYQPAVASANKKQAKADAAQLALQKLGILT
ncbi:hypothetical protein K1T71_001137 [Dendrolimus kikuchii]|uniref:Uncharacterized protein n=1 Tax=Dendrolimus kikuchii TaxID=765133 RepID=A0ACC1DGY7_9NEOP|nr:hypothetical protein K1T71_001137 [Dendrolimus kikuchii]